MISKSYETLCELISKPENLSVDKLDLLVQTSLKFFNEYLELCKSSDEGKKKEALEQLLSLKDKLEETAKKAQEESGLSPSQLMALMNDPAMFSENEWNSMSEIKQSLTEFNTSLLKEVAKPKKEHKVKRATKRTQITA